MMMRRRKKGKRRPVVKMRVRGMRMMTIERWERRMGLPRRSQQQRDREASKRL
jgi:hypothetical protein